MRTLILLADGFEETEAVSIIDSIRRTDITCDLVAVGDSLRVSGSHGIVLEADLLLNDLQPDACYDAVITPGGMDGVKRLMADPRVILLLQRFSREGRLIASICASPLVLEAAGLTEGRRGTSFPGLDEQLSFDTYSDDLVVSDGQLITSRGPATGLLMGVAIVEALADKTVSDKLASALLIPELQDKLQEVEDDIF